MTPKQLRDAANGPWEGDSLPQEDLGPRCGKIALSGLPRYRASLEAGGNQSCDQCQKKACVFEAHGQWCKDCSPFAIWNP